MSKTSMAKEKIICKLCKIVYTTKEELEEHSWSLLHHKEYEAQHGKNSAHDCNLCHTTCVGLSAYVKHLNSDTHRHNRQQRLEGKKVSPPKERDNTRSHRRFSPPDKAKPPVRSSSRKGCYQGTPEGQDAWTGGAGNSSQGMRRGRQRRWDQDPHQTHANAREGHRRWDDQARSPVGTPPAISPRWNNPSGEQFPSADRHQSAGGPQWSQQSPAPFHQNMATPQNCYYVDSFAYEDGFQNFNHEYRGPNRYRQDGHRFGREAERPRSRERRYSPYHLRNRGRALREAAAHMQEDSFMHQRRPSAGLNQERDRVPVGIHGRDRDPNVPEKELERPAKDSIQSGNMQSPSDCRANNSVLNISSSRYRWWRSGNGTGDREKDHGRHESSKKPNSLPSSPKTNTQPLERRRSLDYSLETAERESDSNLRSEQKAEKRTSSETERRSEASHSSRKSSVETPVMKAALLELSKVRKGSFKPTEKDTPKPTVDTEKPKVDRDSYVQQVLSRAENLGNLLRAKRQEESERLPVSLEQKVKRRMERFLTPRGEQKGKAVEGHEESSAQSKQQEEIQRWSHTKDNVASARQPSTAPLPTELLDDYNEVSMDTEDSNDERPGLPLEAAATVPPHPEVVDRKGSSRLDGSYLQILPERDGKKVGEDSDTDSRPTKDISFEPSQRTAHPKEESLASSSHPVLMSQAPMSTQASAMNIVKDSFKSPPTVSKSKDLRSSSGSAETAVLGRSTSCPDERHPRNPSSCNGSGRRISDNAASPSEGRVRRTSESDGSDSEGAAAKVLEKLQLPPHLQKELGKYLSAKNKMGSGTMQPNIAGARSRLKPGSSQRKGEVTETGLPSALIQFLNSPKSRNKQHQQWSQLVQHQQGQKQKATRLPRFGLQLGPPSLSSNQNDLDPQAITINLQDIALHELSMEQLKEISEAAAELNITADSDQETGDRSQESDSVIAGSSARVKVERPSDDVPTLEESPPVSNSQTSSLRNQRHQRHRRVSAQASEDDLPRLEEPPPVSNSQRSSSSLRVQRRRQISSQASEERADITVIPSRFSQPNTETTTVKQESGPTSIQRDTEPSDLVQSELTDNVPRSNDEGHQSEPVRLSTVEKETPVTAPPQKESPRPQSCSVVVKQEKEDADVVVASPEKELQENTREESRNKRTFAEVDAAEESGAAGGPTQEQVKKRKPQDGSESEASPRVNLNHLLTISLQEEGLHRKQTAVEQRIAEVKVIMQKAVDELHQLEVKKAQVVQQVSHLRQKRLEILQGAVSQRSSASNSRASTVVASPTHSTPRDQSPRPPSVTEQSKTTATHNTTLSALDQSAISSANNSGVQSQLTVQIDSSLNLSLGDTTVVRVKEEPVSPTSLSTQGVSQYATPPEFMMSRSLADARRSESYASLPTNSTAKQRPQSGKSSHSSCNDSVVNQPNTPVDTSAQKLLSSSGNVRRKNAAPIFPTLDFSDAEESQTQPLSPVEQQTKTGKAAGVVDLGGEEKTKSQYQSPMLKQLAANFQQLRSASQNFLQESENIVSTPHSTPVVSIHGAKTGNGDTALCSVDDLLLAQPGTSTKDGSTGPEKQQKQPRKGKKKKEARTDNQMRPPSRASSVDSVGSSKGTKKKKKKRKAFFQAAPSETSPDDHPRGPRRKPKSAKKASAAKSVRKGGQAEKRPDRDSFSEIVDSVLSQPRKVMKSPDSTEQVPGELPNPTSPAESVSMIDVPKEEAEVLVIDSDEENKQDQVTSSHPTPTEEQNVVSSTCTGMSTNSSPPEGAKLPQLPRQQLLIQPGVAQKIRKQIKKEASCVGTMKETPSSSQSDPPPPSVVSKTQDHTPGSFVGHTAGVVAIQISGDYLYSVSADMVAKAWSLVSRECVQVYKGHNRKINCLQVLRSQGGEERLYTGSSDKTVRCYNVQTAACVLKYELDDRVLCMHQNWNTLYIGLGNGQVISINAQTKKCVDKFDCHTPRAISCITTGMEGPRRLLLVGSYDATISIRDARDGLLLKTLTGHSKTPLCMQVVNHLVYSGSADTMVMAHNINTGELQGIYKGHSHAVTGIHVVGKVMITASLDRLVRVFEVASQEKLQVYGGQKDMIMCLKVHKSMVYVGCYDGSLTALPLDLTKNFRCWWRCCSLIFGMREHLKQHLGSDHIQPNNTTITCCWKACGKDFCMKKHKLQEVQQHLSAHVDQHYVMET
ncbi:zinc finger protein 106-like isoform X2 [Branchiostoma lanceolatum]|uniref:zinc finger protein 106-like isoform X2 n=1 Tax=Branchiostoma lanceolatum TaxID=7740 RepID=UPI0034565925